MDPISPLWHFGLGVGGVIVCAGLFIWSQISIDGLKSSVTAAVGELVEQRKLITQLLQYQNDFVSKISEQQISLATNQLNLTNSINEVIRELISIIREVEKS